MGVVVALFMGFVLHGAFDAAYKAEVEAHQSR